MNQSKSNNNNKTDIVFNSDTLNVIDKWIDQAKSSGHSNLNNNKTDTNVNSKIKQGLGYNNDKSSSSYIANKLKDRINKSKFKSNRNEKFDNTIDSKKDNNIEVTVDSQIVSNDDDDKYIPMNGLVESNISKLNRSGTKSNNDINVESNIKSNKKRKQSYAELTYSSKEIKFDSSVDDKSTSDGNNINNKFDESKKKRKKTRSKQKNIRKDNRPNELKPNYLKLGSDDYKGRTLTLETQKVLSIQKI